MFKKKKKGTSIVAALKRQISLFCYILNIVPSLSVVLEELGQMVSPGTD